jgi:hypothetical protein
MDDDAAILHVDVVQPEIADLLGSHTVLVRHKDHGPFPRTLAFGGSENGEHFSRFQVNHRIACLVVGFRSWRQMDFLEMQHYVQKLGSGDFGKRFVL